MKRLFAALSAAAILAVFILPVATTHVAAQCTGIFGPGTICGNAGSQSAPPTQVSSSAIGGVATSVTQFGWLCDGTDRSTQASAALSAVAAVGGGTLFFPACPLTTVSSGTYNSGTGAVSLVMTATPSLTVGASINAGIKGTGTVVATVGGGGFSNGDTVSIKFADPTIVSFPVTVTYVLGNGENSTTVATGLKNQINANATLAAAGVTATSSTNAVSILGVASSTLPTFSVTGGSESVAFAKNTFFSIAGPVTTTSGTAGTAVNYTAATGLGTITIVGGGITPTYRADSQLLIPNDNAGVPYQKSLRLTGAGSARLGYPSNFFVYTPAPSILDLRFHNSDSQSGKIESRGNGTLEIDHLELADGSSSNATPMIHDTNTVLMIHDNTFFLSGNVAQDAIVLGGVGSNATDGTLNAAFQGYGTTIENNTMMNGNRLVLGQTFVNSIRVVGNLFPFKGNVGTTAIEFNGGWTSGTPVCPHSCGDGNYVADNLIEMDTYTCGIKITLVNYSVFNANHFWDPGGIGLGNYCFGGQSGPPFVGSSFDTFISAESDVSGTSVEFYDPVGGNIAANRMIGQWAGNKAEQFQQGGSIASFNIPASSNAGDPTTVHDGDVWYTGTNLRFRQGSSSQTIPLGSVFPAPAGTSSLPGSSVGTTAYGMFQATNQLGFSVAGADKLDYGTTNSGSWTFTGNVFTNGSYILGGGTTVLGTPSSGSFGPNSDGVWVLLNNAGTGWGRLQFGGTSSSFPALKRNGTAINVRLADDSGDAPVTAGAATLNRITGNTGSAPTANSCTGFSLATGSSDLAGKVSFNSATTCSITFGASFTNAPFCTITPGSAASTSEVVTTTGGLTVTFGTANTAFYYHCLGT